MVFLGYEPFSVLLAIMSNFWDVNRSPSCFFFAIVLVLNFVAITALVTAISVVYSFKVVQQRGKPRLGIAEHIRETSAKQTKQTFISRDCNRGRYDL